jgi:two-component system response regulator CpxR
MTLLRVLVVDDDRVIRDSLREVLRAEGYDVVIAENGAVALQIIRSRLRPDVVVLDLMMPVMSGWEVLEQLETDASVRDIPVLVVSAMGAPLASSGQHGGVRMSLPKPPDVDTLLAAIEHIVLPTARRATSERQATISPTR